MKCPHCEYEDGYSLDTGEMTKGEKGEFYEISNDIKMERTDSESYWQSTETKTLKGCPACDKLFMS